MREKLRDTSRLIHMIEAINHINEYMEGRTIEDMSQDTMFYFAVVKNIEIIGEAAYKLTKDFLDSHPDTPWRQIIGMRHVLVHGYYQIKPSEVWGVAKNRLNSLKTQLQNYLDETAED